MHIYIKTYTYTCIYIKTYTYTCIYMYMYTYTHTYLCTHIYVHIVYNYYFTSSSSINFTICFNLSIVMLLLNTSSCPSILYFMYKSFNFS